MSLRLQLLISCSLIGMIAAVSTAALVAYITTQKLEAETLRQYEANLTSKRVLTEAKLSAYFELIESQVTTMAFDQSIRAAMADFKLGFDQYEIERGVEAADLDQVESYYTLEFATAFRARNATKIDPESLYSGLSAKTALLQHDFIAANPHPRGEKDKLVDTGFGTSYLDAHIRYHPTFSKFLDAFGYYDIFLVDMAGNVVYSVFKELDYATNLTFGPYRDSGIADAFARAKVLQPGQTYITDFGEYLPSYNDAASFIATPIQGNEGENAGVLIFQMPIEKINSIMIQDENWLEVGFGTSGEIYLVGPDKKLRNESRFFLEDKTAYIDLLKQRGMAEASTIEIKDTSISLQTVDSVGVQRALAGKSGFEVFDDYRDIPVLSSFAPIQIGGHTWAILSEIDESEAFASTAEVLQSIIDWAVTALIGISAFALVLSVLLANRTIRPLSDLAQRLHQLSVEEADLTQRVPRSSTPEINRIGQGFNAFIERLRGSVAQIKLASEELQTETSALSQTVQTFTTSNSQQSDEIARISQSVHAFVAAITNITQLTQEATTETSAAGESASTNSERATLAADNIKHLVNEVNGSVETIGALQSEVKEISDVLAVINSIADQTNLLALNAAIEAARAGEHGRGFAVVADEVRTLASKTQQSTVTIDDQVNRLASAAENAVASMERASTSAAGGIHLVNAVSATLNELNDIIVRLNQANQTIAGQSEQQSCTVKEIDVSVSGIEETAQEVSNNSVQVFMAAQKLANISKQLNQEMNKFAT